MYELSLNSSNNTKLPLKMKSFQGQVDIVDSDLQIDREIDSLSLGHRALRVLYHRSHTACQDHPRLHTEKVSLCYFVCKFQFKRLIP